MVEKMIRAVVAAICRHTESPVITESMAGYTLQVRGDHGDHGRIVGRDGLVIWALSTVVFYASGATESPGAGLRLLEPIGESRRGPSLPFKLEKDWDETPVSRMLDSIFAAVFPVFPGVISARRKWTIERRDGGHAAIVVSMEKYLKAPMSSPSFEEAVTILIKAAGRSSGAAIDVSFLWS